MPIGLILNFQKNGQLIIPDPVILKNDVKYKCYIESIKIVLNQYLKIKYIVLQNMYNFCQNDIFCKNNNGQILCIRYVKVMDKCLFTENDEELIFISPTNTIELDMNNTTNVLSNFTTNFGYIDFKDEYKQLYINNCTIKLVFYEQ